jgi:hypothetical protein
MAIKIPTSFIARSSKIYPNCDFLFENLATLLDRAAAISVRSQVPNKE